MAYTARQSEEELRERFDSPEELAAKLDQLAELVRNSKHFVAFTGAGISTSAGIPDFRGPEGVWTLKAQGRERTGKTVSTINAFPTKTHMALVELQRRGVLKHLISQNTDGLLRRSGFHPTALSELHGNGNMEECETCQRRYYRDFSARRLPRLHEGRYIMTKDHFTGRHCGVCGGKLLEWTIDFGQNLPEDQLGAALQQSKLADVHLTLGSSLTVSPACDMPATTGKKKRGALVIVNLQITPLDDFAKLRIFARTDDVMQGLMERLAIPIPEWRLHRRAILSVRHSEAGADLVVQGVDTHQQLPATLFTQVDVVDADRNATKRSTAEPHAVAFAKHRPANVRVTLHFQGHYREPPVDVLVDMSTEGDYLQPLTFNPFTGVWELGEATDCPLDFLNGVLLKKRDPVGLHRTLALAVVSDRQFGNWPTASLVQLEGRPVAVVVGGRRHAVSFVDLTSGAVVSPEVAGPFVEKSRWGHSATVVEGKIVLFGGWDSECQYGDAAVFDVAAGAVAALQTTGDRPSARSCHAAAAVGTTLYVFGGAACCNGPYEHYADLFALDLPTRRWERIAPSGPSPEARSQHSLVAVDHRLVLIGGGNQRKALDDVWAFDTQTRQWERLWEHCGAESGIPCIESLPQTDFRVNALRHTATLIGPRLLVWGNWGMSMLNLATRSWTRLRAPPKVVANAVCTDGNTLWSVGGMDPDSSQQLPVLRVSN